MLKKLAIYLSASAPLLLNCLPTFAEELRPFTSFTADPNKIISLPECPAQAEPTPGTFVPSEKNFLNSSSSRGSFFVDASARTGNFDQDTYEKLLQKLHSQTNKSADATLQVKCLNYFLKRSNLKNCTDLNLEIPPQASISHYPSIKKVFQCSPGKAVLVTLVESNGQNGVFIIDPFRKIKIRAVSADFKDPDYFAAATEEKHVYQGNLLITPPGEEQILGQKSYDSATRNAKGSKFIIGDDYTYLFEGSPFWANIISKDLLALTSGELGKASVPIEKQIGLELTWCSHACLRAIKQDHEDRGWFFRPRGFWANLEERLSNYPNGVPIVTSVTPGSEAYQEGIRENVLILTAGNISTGMGGVIIPYAASIESVRENIINSGNFLDILITALVDGPKGKVDYSKKIGWLRSKYKND